MSVWELMESAATHVLVERIRSYTAVQEEQRGGSPTRRGLPAAEEAVLADLLRERRAAAASERVARAEGDLDRRRTEYFHILRSPDEHDEEAEEGVFVPAMPTADVDGKAVLLEPLKALFHMLLLRHRVRRRLRQLRPDAGGPPRVPEARAASRGALLRLPRFAAMGTPTSTSAATLPTSDTDTFFRFLRDWDVTGMTGERRPFLYALQDYSLERFPEFALHVTARAGEEVARRPPPESSTEEVPILHHYTPPNTTLETYPTPLGTFDMRAAAPFGDLETQPYAISAEERVMQEPHRPSSATLAFVPPSAILTGENMASLPCVMGKAQPEDAMSDSGSSEEPARAFRPDLRWVPRLSDSLETAAPAAEAAPWKESAMEAFIARYC